MKMNDEMTNKYSGGSNTAHVQNFEWSEAVWLVNGSVVEWLVLFGSTSCILIYWFCSQMVGSST